MSTSALPDTSLHTSSTAELASYASSLRLGDVPADVIVRAKHLMLDGFGCALLGAALPWTITLVRSLGALGGGSTPVWGTSTTMTPDQACLANGAAVQGYELDDYSKRGGLHSCAVILPAVASTIQIRGALSGAEALAAVIAGFEVGNRVGEALGATALTNRGWHTGGVIGPMAAAAAAGRALGLTPTQMEHAFGIAATQAGGLMAAQYGSMVKRMHHGRAAQSGLYGAVLAAGGYTGIKDVFEQEFGGYATFVGPASDVNVAALGAGLGETFRVMDTCIKPYACNARIHAPIDALRHIATTKPVNRDTVRSVTVRSSAATVKKTGWRYDGATKSATSAQMNMSYCLAAFLLEGDVFIDQFREALLDDPSLIELTERVHIVHEAEFDTLPTHLRHRTVVEVEFTDGDQRTTGVDAALGSPGSPIDNPAIVAKYDKLVAKAVPDHRAAEIKASVLELDQLADAADLVALLTRDGSWASPS